MPVLYFKLLFEGEVFDGTIIIEFYAIIVYFHGISWDATVNSVAVNISASQSHR